jgi:hypothetical protein
MIIAVALDLLWPCDRRRVTGIGSPDRRAYRMGGLVLFQVGTALVTPTDGQLYVPIDGAVTVPTDCPLDP